MSDSQASEIPKTQHMEKIITWKNLFMRIFIIYIIYAIAEYFVDPLPTDNYYTATENFIRLGIVSLMSFFFVYTITSLIIIIFMKIFSSTRSKPLTSILSGTLIVALMILIIGLYGRWNINQKLVDNPSPTKLRAAQKFEGYYLGKTTAIDEYCQRKGVDLSKYLSLVNDVEAKTHDKAVMVLSENGYIFGAAYKDNRDFALREAENAMETLRMKLAQQHNSQSITIEDACRIFLITDRKLMGQFSFAIEHPDYYQALMK